MNIEILMAYFIGLVVGIMTGKWRRHDDEQTD